MRSSVAAFERPKLKLKYHFLHEQHNSLSTTNTTILSKTKQHQQRPTCAVGWKLLQMPHDVDELARRVGVRERPVIHGCPKVREDRREAMESVVWDVGSVGAQEFDLGGLVVEDRGKKQSVLVLGRVVCLVLVFLVVWHVCVGIAVGHVPYEHVTTGLLPPSVLMARRWA
eukprot:2552173-Rhodomonas_salina.1